MTENDNYNFGSEVFIPSDGSMEREQARSKARRKAHKKKSAKQQWVRAILWNLRFLALRVAGLLREADDEKWEDAYRRWVHKRAENIISTVKRTVCRKERARFFRFLAKASKGKLSPAKQWDKEIQVEAAYEAAHYDDPHSFGQKTFEEVRPFCNIGMAPRSLRRLLQQLGLPLRRDKRGRPLGSRNRKSAAR
jgi:hypothetical protein